MRQRPSTNYSYHVTLKATAEKNVQRAKYLPG